MSHRIVFRLLSIIIYFLTPFFLSTLLAPSNGLSQTETRMYYGAHSHIYRPQEWRHFPKNLDKMCQGGLSLMRTDFLWDLVEKSPGTWDFSQYDRIVEEAEKRGIEVLGILGYSVSWAKPAHRHPKQWSEYVTRTVSRYKGRVRYWEVWNEENISSFWKGPSPVDYTQFLKITAEAARKADPETKLLFGGTALIPYEFIEDCFKEGAGKYFDVMNIHPYRNVMNSASAIKKFEDDISQLRNLMNKYELSERPIWITEMGWSDFGVMSSGCREFVSAALSVLSPDIPVKEVAFLHDPERYQPSVLLNEFKFQYFIPKGIKAKAISLEELHILDPQQTPFLLMPPSESFPTDYFDTIYTYVQKGGTLFFTSGFPCYYNASTKEGLQEGRPGENSAGRFREKFRIDINAWWMNSDIPQTADQVVPKEEYTRFFKNPQNLIKADRFLGSRLLKEGDRLEPILFGQKGEFSEPVAGIYRFNSDLKGNIAVYTLYDAGMTARHVTSEEIGIYLPQTYLIAFSAGIERFFMYQFQARENDPQEIEDHFGLVHADLSPKEGYIALAALAKARPNGSIDRRVRTENEIRIFSWDRPDGLRGWALWNPSGKLHGKYVIDGNVTQAFDHLGNRVPFDPEKTGLTAKILYLIGPKEIDFQIE